MSGHWTLLPRLSVPDLRPCAVLCAVFDKDPVAAARELAARGTDKETAWDAGFRAVTVDRAILLTDYEPRPSRSSVDASGRVTVTVTTTAVAISSSSPEGPRWLATKILRVGDERWCWCVPFEAKLGARAEVRLTAANRLRLGVDLLP